MASSSAVPFSSDLPDAQERLLAHMLSDGVARGLRSADDLLENFDPLQIMLALKDQPELRAKILEPNTGTRAKIAMRKTPESAGIDLQLALEEGETDAASITEYFGIDDQVRYLDRGALWTHCTETRFWTRGFDDEGFVDAQQHILHLIEVAGSEGLIAPEDIVKGLTPARLMEALPAELRTRILDATLAAGRDGSPFSDFELLEVVPVSELSEHLPLEIIWSEVLEPALAPGGPKAAKAEVKASAPAAKAKPKAPKIEVVDKEKGSPYPITDDDSDLFDSDSLLDEIQLHEFEVDEVSEEITVS